MAKEKTGERKRREPSDFTLDAVTSLIVLAVLDVGTIIAYTLLLFITNPLTNEAVARGLVAARDMEIIRSGGCALIYFVLMLIVTYNNVVERGAFVNSDESRDTNYGREFVAYAKRCGLIHLAASAIITLPVHIAVAIYRDIKVIPTLFIPFYSFIELTGNVWLSYIVNIVFYTAVMLLFAPLCRVIWDKKRLRK